MTGRILPTEELDTTAPLVDSIVMDGLDYALQNSGYASDIQDPEFINFLKIYSDARVGIGEKIKEYVQQLRDNPELLEKYDLSQDDLDTALANLL